MLDSSALKISSPIRTAAAGILVAAIVWLCLFAHLGAIGFVGPDEPRYAEVAHEMARSGDWVTPRLYGEPWFEKPILHYWAAAAGYRLFRDPEVAARLPSALAALLALLALSLAAWKFYGNETAWAAALIFSTCAGTLAFARAATPDMLFASALAVSMFLAAEVLRRQGTLRSFAPAARAEGDRLILLFFGASLGVAALAKGPAALVLAGGSAGIWALATRRWRAAFRLAHPLAILAFCVVALPWYVLCALRNPGFLRTFLFLHNYERYLTPVFRHPQPFWFFVPIVLLALLPWTALLAGVAIEGIRLWRARTASDSPGFFFACWAIVPVVFFSFSHSKLPGYILPAIPPLALLCAISAVRIVNERREAARWIIAAAGLTWIAALALPLTRWLNFFTEAQQRYAESKHILIWLVVAAASGLFIAVLAWARRGGAALVACSILFATMVEIANRRIIPELDPYLSPRATALTLQALPEIHGNLATFHLQRNWRDGVNFYFGAELPEWTPQTPGRMYVLTNPQGFEEIESTGIAGRWIEDGGISPQAWLVVVGSQP